MDIKNLLRDIKNLLGDIKNLLGDTKNLLGDIKNLLGYIKNLLGDIENLLGYTENLLGDEAKKPRESVHPPLDQTLHLSALSRVKAFGMYSKQTEMQGRMKKRYMYHPYSDVNYKI